MPAAGTKIELPFVFEVNLLPLTPFNVSHVDVVFAVNSSKSAFVGILHVLSVWYTASSTCSNVSKLSTIPLELS